MLLSRHTRRREFITLVGGAAAWPLAARAQQPGRTYRLGFFLPVARDAPAIIAFFDELRVHGFVEGQNLAIIPGGFQAGNNQIDDLVPALIKAAPDAIIAGGDVIPRALQNATGQFRSWSSPRTWSRLGLRPRLPARAAISPESA